MEAKAQLQSYEQVEFSIKLTAPVTDWRAMMKQLEKMKGDSFMYGWPLSSLVGCIDKMLCDLDKTHADSVRAEDQSQYALKTANRTQPDEPSEVAVRRDRSDWRD